MEVIQNLDYTILNAIQHSLRCKFLDSFTIILSYVTTSGIIWVVLGVTMLFFSKLRRLGIILIITLAFVFLTGDILLKHLVNRPRPFVMYNDIVPLIKAPSSASFPSTHICLDIAATTVLLKKKKKFGFIALALTACIAFSRLYLCVHFPTDILAGLLLGILCALIVLRLDKQVNLRRKISRDSN